MSYDNRSQAMRVVEVNAEGGDKQGVKVDSAQAATGVALTRTIAAVVGKRHRLAFLHIIGYNTAARTGAAAPVAVTVAGLDNGTMNLPFPTAGAIGTRDEFKYEGVQLLEGAVNTALVVTCPATVGIIWSVIIGYTTAA